MGLDLSGLNHPCSMGLQSWDDEFAAMLFPDSSDEAPLPWTDVGQLPEEGLIDFHDIVLPMESAAEPLAAGIVEDTVSVPEPLFVATGSTSQETSGAVKRQRITGKKPQKAAEPIAAASVTRRAGKEQSGASSSSPTRMMLYSWRRHFLLLSIGNSMRRSGTERMAGRGTFSCTANMCGGLSVM